MNPAASTAAPGRPAADIKVAPMRTRHLDQVLAIEQRAYPKPWTERLFRSELAQTSTRRYFVALDANGTFERIRPTVVGYAGVMVHSDEGHVTNVAVDPAQHRRKIASRLLVALMRGARNLGASAVTLEARTANAGAQKLYERFGFVSVGVRPGYYTDTGEDALIMWLRGMDEPAYAELLQQIEARLDRPGGSSGEPDYRVPWVQGRTGIPGATAEAGPGTAPDRNHGA